MLGFVNPISVSGSAKPNVVGVYGFKPLVLECLSTCLPCKELAIVVLINSKLDVKVSLHLSMCQLLVIILSHL